MFSTTVWNTFLVVRYFLLFIFIRPNLIGQFFRCYFTIGRCQSGNKQRFTYFTHFNKCPTLFASFVVNWENNCLVSNGKYILVNF
jgi:hypothetical protein